MTKKIVWQVTGLTCASRARQIEQVLLQYPGVADVWALAHAGKVRLQYDPGKADLTAMQGEIGRLGCPIVSTRYA